MYEIEAKPAGQSSPFERIGLWHDNEIITTLSLGCFTNCPTFHQELKILRNEESTQEDIDAAVSQISTLGESACHRSLVQEVGRQERWYAYGKVDSIRRDLRATCPVTQQTSDYSYEHRVISP